MGLFKNEAIRKGSPFRPGRLKGLPDVEAVTFGWVDWYNTSRLHSTLGNIPPDRIRGRLLRSRNRPVSRRSRQQRSGLKPGTVQTVRSTEMLLYSSYRSPAASVRNAGATANRARASSSA